METKRIEIWYNHDMDFIQALLSIKESNVHELLHEIQVVASEYFTTNKTNKSHIFFGLVKNGPEFSLILPNKTNNLGSDADCLYRAGIDDILFISYIEQRDCLKLAWDTEKEKGCGEINRSGNFHLNMFKSREITQLPNIESINKATLELASSIKKQKAA